MLFLIEWKLKIKRGIDIKFFKYYHYLIFEIYKLKINYGGGKKKMYGFAQFDMNVNN